MPIESIRPDAANKKDLVHLLFMCISEISPFWTRTRIDAAAEEMFRKRVGHSIRTAYCAFVLRKFNDHWYTEENGKSWFDPKATNS